jgi:hypothetical protein
MPRSPWSALRGTVLALLIGAGPLAALAWSNHPLCTWQALDGLPGLAGKTVKAVPLEQFVAEQAPQLERLLAQQEAWARANLADYPARPEALAFVAAPTGAAAAEAPRARFLQALRLNPHSRLPLFVQLRPGDAAPERPRMPWVDITALRSGAGARTSPYALLAPGEAVSALDVVATASNEPDYGLDLGLFEDNGTPEGGRYGYGRQPFGNATVDYASQAPFHMGFYHEAGIVYAAAKFLRRTHPEARIALFSALARHAFASGHDYWGWRFTGWALHYVQDLTQPYHATVLPGVSVPRMLGINLLAILGYGKPKDDAVMLVSNRHLVVETYQAQRMAKAYAQGRMDDPLLAALRDPSGDRGHWRFEPASVRGVISRESNEASGAFDAQIERSFPAKYTSDPTVSLGNDVDQLPIDTVAQAHSEAEQRQLDRQLATLMANLGRHSRALVRSLTGVGSGP